MRLQPNRPPTSEEINNNAYVEEFDAYSLWYPSTGGYVGKAWIQFDDNGAEEGARSNIAMLPGGCFELYLYHDGEFPRNDEKPRVTHHCNWKQFIEFGETIGELEKQRREKNEV